MNKNNALKREVREQQLAAARAAVPLSVSTAEHLFESLDEELAKSNCDHTLRITRDVLADERLGNIDVVIDWLREHGGYCDCEVLANVEEYWESLRDRSP